MAARPLKMLSIIWSVLIAYITAWRATLLSHGALVVLNMMKRVPKPWTWSTLQPADSISSMASAVTDSMTSVVPCCWAVMRAVASTRMS